MRKIVPIVDAPVTKGLLKCNGVDVYSGDSSTERARMYGELVAQGEKPVMETSTKRPFNSRKRIDYASPETWKTFLTLPSLIQRIYMGLLSQTPVEVETLMEAERLHPEYFK